MLNHKKTLSSEKYSSSSHLRKQTFHTDGCSPVMVPLVWNFSVLGKGTCGFCSFPEGVLNFTDTSPENPVTQIFVPFTKEIYCSTFKN